MALVICGFQRSGTTLMRNLSTMHPDIEVTNELVNFLWMEHSRGLYMRKFIRHCYKRANKRYPIRKIVSQIPLKVQIENYIFVIKYLFNLHRVVKKNINFSDVEQVLKAMFPHTRIHGDKFPYYIFKLDELVKLNNVSCAVIYRDCRDVVSSFLLMVRSKWRKEKWIKDQSTASQIALKWVSAIDSMERNQDKIHIIRYEDLVTNPEQELGTYAKWLGVDPDGFNGQIVRSSSIGKHKTGLTDKELADVLDIAGPTLKRLNYL